MVNGQHLYSAPLILPKTQTTLQHKSASTHPHKFMYWWQSLPCKIQPCKQKQLATLTGHKPMRALVLIAMNPLAGCGYGENLPSNLHPPQANSRVSVDKQGNRGWSAHCLILIYSLKCFGCCKIRSSMTGSQLHHRWLFLYFTNQVTAKLN